MVSKYKLLGWSPVRVRGCCEAGEWGEEVIGAFLCQREEQGHKAIKVEFCVPGDLTSLPFWREVSRYEEDEEYDPEDMFFFMDDGWLSRPGVEVK